MCRIAQTFPWSKLTITQLTASEPCCPDPALPFALVPLSVPLLACGIHDLIGRNDLLPMLAIDFLSQSLRIRDPQALSCHAAGMGSALSFHLNATALVGLQPAATVLRSLDLNQLTCSVSAVDIDNHSKDTQDQLDHGLLAAVSGLKLSISQGMVIRQAVP